MIHTKRKKMYFAKSFSRNAPKKKKKDYIMAPKYTPILNSELMGNLLYQMDCLEQMRWPDNRLSAKQMIQISIYKL